MSFIAQEQRQDCKRASANACLKINQWKVSNFKHKKSICRGLSLLHDRISDHWGDTSKFSSQTARGLILPMKQRQLFDLDPWPAATLELAEAHSGVDHPWGRGSGWDAVLGYSSHPGHGSRAAEEQAGPQSFSHLCWKQFNSGKRGQSLQNTSVTPEQRGGTSGREGVNQLQGNFQGRSWSSLFLALCGFLFCPSSSDSWF